ncbi:hypothetical protein IAG41_09700 [Sphingomonas sp. JC676]|uniref:Fur family transcriptional regulator n=1 Tax=Sphingomonas sp. JC676 TaxID=2768065 RepID=UPI001657F09C|nr:hypothetical protein [Sphingomonas sp. JC676]MBC9032665.1 hypothetical protein [Sphingomonas sp. JC676]
MAKAKRRPHYLQDAILQILRDERRPLSGRELAERLRYEGNAVPLSMIFRAIRRLIDREVVRKILVAGGYAPVSEKLVAVLWCRECGELTEIHCAEAFNELGNLAAAAGLTDPRYFVEFAGLCARCTETLADRDSR